MIRYLKHHEIDKAKWDAALEEAVNGNIYACSWYLDTVCANWEALVEDDYQRIFPLPVAKKLGVVYLYQPHFVQQLGLYSRSILSPDCVEAFLEAIPPHIRYVDMHLNSYNTLLNCRYQVYQRINHELNLIQAYEELRKNYSQNVRRNLKKAEKQQLQLLPNVSPEAVIELFRANRGKTLKHLQDKHYSLLNRVMYTAIQQGRGEVLAVADTDSRVLAAAFFTRSHHKAVFLFSGATADSKKKGAMFFLIDQFIQQHARTETTLDFEGSNDPNLARFYKSFGSVCLNYPHLIINRFRGPAGGLINAYKKWRSH